MRRSEINRLMDESVAFAGTHGFLLPPFAVWSPAEWKAKGAEADEIRDCMLGWDLTDFGSGDFARVGLIMFTIRNGHLTNPRYTKPYCEKMLISDDAAGHADALPLEQGRGHHQPGWRRSGRTALQLHAGRGPGRRVTSRLSVDGVAQTVKAGGLVRLAPGESIFLAPGLYHKFWGDRGQGADRRGVVDQ